MRQRNYFKLNEGEKTVGSSDVFSVVFDRGGFLLTTQRVIKVDRSAFGDRSKVHSINLENLDSVETSARVHLWTLLLAVMSLLYGLREDANVYVALAGVAIFVALFFLLRRKVIKLASGNSIMWLNVSAMAHEQIQELVFSVEEAKQQRLEGLQHRRDPSGPPESVRSRLEELKALLEDGLISPSEYEERRVEIIAEL